MNFFKTFIQLFKELIPVVFFLMLIGIILVAGSRSSLTPFIYTLF